KNNRFLGHLRKSSMIVDFRSIGEPRPIVARHLRLKEIEQGFIRKIEVRDDRDALLIAVVPKLVIVPTVEEMTTSYFIMAFKDFTIGVPVIPYAMHTAWMGGQGPIEDRKAQVALLVNVVVMAVP